MIYCIFVLESVEEFNRQALCFHKEKPAQPILNWNQQKWGMYILVWQPSSKNTAQIGFLYVHPILTIQTFLLLLFQYSQLHSVFRKRRTETSGIYIAESFALLNLAHGLSSPSCCTVTEINIFWSCWTFPCITSASQKGCSWPSNMLVLDKIWSLEVQMCKWAIGNQTLHWPGGTSTNAIWIVLVRWLFSTETTNILSSNYKTDEHVFIFWCIKGNLPYTATSFSSV